MTDKSEQVPLGHLTGMPQPEEYLWDLPEGEDDDIFTPDPLPEEFDNNIDDQEYGEDTDSPTSEDGLPPSMDTLPPVSTNLFDDESQDSTPAPRSAPLSAQQPERIDDLNENRKVSKKKLKKVLPQESGDHPYAKLDRELSKGEIKRLQKKLSKQPVFYKKAQSYEKRSKFAQQWGWIIGLVLSGLVLVTESLGYFTVLKDNPRANLLPERISNLLPQSLIDLYVDNGVGDILTITGGIMLLFAGILATSLMVIALLRVMLLFRPALMLTMFAHGFASVVIWRAVMDHSLTPWSVMLVAAIAMIIGATIESIARWLRLG